MSVLKIPQLVQKGLGELNHSTLQVIKTNTLGYGSLLKYDLTESQDIDLEVGTFDAPYIVDDYSVLDSTVLVGDYLTLSVVTVPQNTILDFNVINIKGVPLTPEQQYNYINNIKPLNGESTYDIDSAYTSEYTEEYS